MRSPTQRALGASAAFLMATAVASAEPVVVRYGMSIAGLPIGSATLVMTPNGQSTQVQISGSAGGPLEIGKMTVTAMVAAGNVTAQSQSGSGKNATSASLSSQGSPSSSAFSFTNVTGRGPGKLAMTVASGRVTALDNQVPDNPRAERVPVTDAHKAGVVDPLMLLTHIVKPGGTLRPEGVCGRTHQVFTGVSRVNLSGTATQEQTTLRGLPEGWRAVSCRVTTTPVAGHRIDKGNRAEARTASVVFAINGDKAVLWSLTVPGTFGSFALTARDVR